MKHHIPDESTDDFTVQTFTLGRSTPIGAVPETNRIRFHCAHINISQDHMLEPHFFPPITGLRKNSVDTGYFVNAPSRSYTLILEYKQSRKSSGVKVVAMSKRQRPISFGVRREKIITFSSPRAVLVWYGMISSIGFLHRLTTLKCGPNILHPREAVYTTRLRRCEYLILLARVRLSECPYSQSQSFDKLSPKI